MIAAPKLSELKQIREALNLSQAEMGALFGVKQGVYQRWEVAPNSPKGREAAEQAREIYRKRTKKEWAGQEAPAPAGGPYATASEVAELRGALRAHVEQWERGTEKLLERLEALARKVDRLAEGDR